ncbi:MAG: endonuclease MutS2 [Lachnospiraceae bacterium]|nr:endonuclease MutS2 [Lachnospiraceae bacterium]
MNKKVLTTLEFDKQIRALEGYATTDKGREYCKNIRSLSDMQKIKKYLTQTNDALTRIFKYGEISFTGASDMEVFRKRLEIESSLSAGELLQVASLLAVSKRAKKYGSSDARGNEIEDSLSAYFDHIDPLDSLYNEITRCILSENEIADEASPELYSVRKSILKTNEKIRNELNGMLNKASVRDALQEAVITSRLGRFCLPVRADSKAKVPGMVHDQSSTGSTLFIEPMAVVTMNNELKELELKEKEEIAAILKHLSQLAGESFDIITNNYSVLTRLDFIFAKAMLAKEQNASLPQIKEGGAVILKKAVHPALDPKTAVPLNLVLGEDYHTLIITGPNTGGKTVALKTVGLLCLMALSGLFIPAGDRCEIPLFTEIYADIGDEQSIEQSLSTFSSHMTNIVSVLKGLKKRKESDNVLVLYDELCSGTDPAEGAALAVSILEETKNAGALCMATTHYSELKLYALSSENVENASCEFDVETLSPTYRLLIGVPGKSNAFAISKKLGLSDDILSDAKERMNEQDQSFDDLFTDMEAKRIAMEKDREDIRREREEIAALKQSYSDKNRRLEERRDKILREANEKASNILKDAKNNADAAIRNINKYGDANADMAKLEQERQKLGKKLKTTVTKSVQPVKTTHKQLKPQDLHIGDAVKVLSMNLTGTVHTLPDKDGNLEILMGIMHTKVHISDLVLVEEKNPYAPKSKKERKMAGVAKGAGAFSKSAYISAELMLLGMTTDEAVATLDKYLDDAYLSHLEQVRIVHGKGTGALRNAVHDRLRRNKTVDSFRLGEYGEGDVGVTIVKFKM